MLAYIVACHWTCRRIAACTCRTPSLSSDVHVHLLSPTCRSASPQPLLAALCPHSARSGSTSTTTPSAVSKAAPRAQNACLADRASASPTPKQHLACPTILRTGQQYKLPLPPLCAHTNPPLLRGCLDLWAPLRPVAHYRHGGSPRSRDGLGSERRGAVLGARG